MHAGLLPREGYRLGDFCLCSWGIQGEAYEETKDNLLSTGQHALYKNSLR